MAAIGRQAISGRSALEGGDRPAEINRLAWSALWALEMGPAKEWQELHLFEGSCCLGYGFLDTRATSQQKRGAG